MIRRLAARAGLDRGTQARGARGIELGLAILLRLGCHTGLPSTGQGAVSVLAFQDPHNSPSWVVSVPG
jgi:hypothetical protein